MAVTIISESYGPRKPFVVCTAASTDELADYAGLWAEGSEATISDTKYVLDKTNGWVLPGQSGKELPAVTAEDDGDVLTVVSGAWGKAAPSGGGSGVLVVTYIVTDTENEVISSSHTANEIYEHMANGGMAYAWVYAQFGDGEIEIGRPNYVLRCESYEKTGNHIDLYFSSGFLVSQEWDTAIELEECGIGHEYGTEESPTSDTFRFDNPRYIVPLTTQPS